MQQRLSSALEQVPTTQPLTSLYAQLRTRLEKLTRSRARGHTRRLVSHQDVDDILQETFCRALHAIRRRRYDSTRALYPYLSAISRHVLACLARDRSRQRRNAYRLEAAPPDEEQFRWPEDGEEDEDTRSERLAGVVRACLAEQPLVVRALCQRRFWLGESQRTAAQNLQLSRQQVRTLEEHLLGGLRARLLCADAAERSAQRLRSGHELTK
jgi:RNA polymerase sigma factor (sigma-70 family)